MSQPKISASSTAVWSFAPAAATASKSERSIRPRTVRLRISSGFCSTSALRPEGSRDTLSVWLSLSRRSSPKSSPSLWVKRSASPGAGGARGAGGAQRPGGSHRPGGLVGCGGGGGGGGGDRDAAVQHGPGHHGTGARLQQEGRGDRVAQPREWLQSPLESECHR